MVGFYDFSDTDNESAVEEIISQAQDACVLEQVSAINCSGITNSVLPSHLETRFRNLKSFPPTKARTIPNPTSRNEASFNFSPSKQNPDSGYTSSHDKKGVEEKPKDGSVSSPPFSPSSDESSMSSIFKSAKKEGSKQDSPPSASSSPSPSPPRRRGCLWCSPKKKEQKKKSKENWSDEFLSSFGSFSMKEQQKMLKKAMKEQEKVNREAEKIVQWAKQASARMKTSDIDDEHSD